MTPHRAASSGWRAALSRLLAAGYRPRDRAGARAFIDEALDDARRRGRRGATLRVILLCIADMLRTRWQPAGLPITAAPISARRQPSARSSAMDQILQDIRYGVRQLRRQPGFAAAAVLTMALGIGGNTAIFNVAWHALLRPLPYPESHQLVEVWEVSTRNQAPNHSMPGKFRDLQRESRSFAHVAAYTARAASTDLTGDGDPEQLRRRSVTADYFAVFSMPPLVGRTLNADDMPPGRPAVVISESLWRRRFGARRDLIGSTIRLDGQPTAVVGVMPEAFSIEGGRVDVWAPFALPPDEPRLAAHYLRVVGRLASGVTLAQANAEVRAIAARAAAAYPGSDGALTQRVDSIVAARRASSARDGLLLLAFASAAVLLIACANLASLQMARGVARQREFGIRTALGATRRRVATQLLTEGLILSLLGAAAGLALAVGALRVLAVVAPPDIRVAAIEWPDGVVVGFALALAVLSAILFSMAPAWRTTRQAAHWIRQRTETTDARGATIRLWLVGGQIGVAVALLIGATLLVSSLTRVLAVDPGFRADGALTFDASLPARIDTYAQQRQLFDRIAESVAVLPGVTSVCAINEIPLDTVGGMTYVPQGQTRMIGAAPRNVTAGCFDALGLRLHRGRAFRARETTRVAIVSESFATTAWPDQDPIGQRVHQGVVGGDLIEIVGVVADAQQVSLEMRAAPQLYEAWTERSAFWPQRFVIRADVPPASLFAAVRAAVRGVDPDQTVARLRTLADVVEQSVAARHFNLRLIGGFSLIALLLAAVGVYGVLSQLVAQRTREIGVRLALGATPQSVVRLMLKSAGAALLVGLPLGLGGAWLASGLMGRFMFRMSATEPRIYAGVAIVLTVVVVLAAWLPARRAAAIDPAGTLR